MRSLWLSSFRGYVQLSVQGKQPETFINLALKNQFIIWKITRTNDGIHLFIHLSDYFRIRPLLKQTGCRMHVLQRKGFPFFMDKLEKRKLFVAGAFGFVVMLYLLSSIVWQVSIEGDENLKRSEIVQAAREIGIYPLQWKPNLSEPDQLSRRLQAKLPGTAWVGVEVRGSHVRIKIVESTSPDPAKLLNPRHLISAHDAEIISVFVDRGKPVVKLHQIVRKGDVLISGIIGDEENEQIVAAEGKVTGKVWKLAEASAPLEINHKVLTGAKKNKWYFVIAGRMVQIKGYGQTEYEQFERRSFLTMLHWRNYGLPIGWMKVTELESQSNQEKVSQQEAFSIALEQARADVLEDAGSDAQIVGEKIILHDRTDNGKVYIRVFFEVIQQIAVEQIIIDLPNTTDPNKGD